MSESERERERDWPPDARVPAMPFLARVTSCFKPRAGQPADGRPEAAPAPAAPRKSFRCRVGWSAGVSLGPFTVGAFRSAGSGGRPVPAAAFSVGGFGDGCGGGGC